MALANGIFDNRRFVSLAALLFLPFQNSPIINFNLFDVRGLKPFTLLAAMAIACELAGRGEWKFRDSTERSALLWYFLYLFAFFLVFAHSIPHVPLFHAEMPSQFRADPFSYFLSFFLRPALSTCLFPLIIRQFKTDAEIRMVRRTVEISMAALSASVLAVILFNPDIYAGTRRTMGTTFERYLGLHYNSIGTIYIVTGPLLVYAALEGRVFPKLNVLLAAIVVAAIQSRSALILFWMESILLLLVLHKGLIVPASIAVAAGVLHWWWSAPTLTAVGSIGLTDGALTPDSILSGRVGIWAPLVREWVADPVLLVWGAGRFGILTSEPFRTGEILRVTHAHNAFVDLFLDAGVVGVAIVVIALGTGIWRAWCAGRSIRVPLFWALAMGLCGYLAGTLTERSFFPSYDNLLVFPVLALLVNVGRAAPAAAQPFRVASG